jgi:hypothetical protein
VVSLRFLAAIARTQEITENLRILDGEWDRVYASDVQAAEQTAHPPAVCAGGLVTALRRRAACIQIGEQPKIANM